MMHNSLWFLPMAAIVAPAFAVDYLSVNQAQKALFPSAEQFVEYPTNLSKDEKKLIKKRSGVRQRQDQQPIWKVMADDQLQGWFIVDDVIGKHEYITYAVAISPQGEVMGVDIMSYRETHGGEVRDEAWREHFVGKTVESTLKLDEDIPNISGATLSSRNITDGVKRLLVLHNIKLKNTLY